MEILERNYSDCLQNYLFSEGDENDSEAKILLRLNLLSRLSKLIEGKLSHEDKVENIYPKTSINITKIINPDSDKSMFLSELKVDGMNFPTIDDSIEDTLVENLDNMGIKIPSEDVNKRLNNFYKNKITSSPFNLINLKGETSHESEISEKEFSYIEESLYSEDEDIAEHNRMVRAVSLLALHKHVTENPSSPRERLIKGIDNLSASIDDLNTRKELKDYLLIYVDKPASRPMMVKESELVVKIRSDKAGKGIPTWVIISIITALLVGGIVYSQRDRIKAAWNASNGLKNTEGVKPDFSTKKTFFQMLFTKNGRETAKGWVNNTKNYRSTDWEIKDMPLRKRRLEVERDEAARNLKDIFEKWGKK